MSTYTEQEELEKLKSWWKTYGNALILGVIVGIALLVGNKYWTQYKEQRLAEASTLYAQMLQDVAQGQADKARSPGEKLVNEYASTPYGGLAALLLARLSFESGDSAVAQKHLRWAMVNGAHAATTHSARLRLSRLLAEAGQGKEALALLDVKDRSGYENEYEELKGDLLLAQNRIEEARAAYTAALARLPKDSPYGRVLAMKLENLGPGK